MKRILRIMAAALVAVTLVFPLASCVKEKLAAPTELTINYDYIASWSKIDDARRYEIKITETETQTEKPLVYTNKASYDFSDLSAGTYRIFVRSVAGDEKHTDSEWSAPLEFTRDHETGCTYTLINNGAAYEITKCSAPASDDIIIEDIYPSYNGSIILVTNEKIDNSKLNIYCSSKSNIEWINESKNIIDNVKHNIIIYSISTSLYYFNFRFLNYINLVVIIIYIIITNKENEFLKIFMDKIKNKIQK